MAVEFKPDIILTIFSWPISNSLLASFLSLGLIFLTLFIFKKRLKEAPGRFQAAIEIIYEGFFDFYNDILESSKQTKVFFSFLFAFFLYVIVSNWIGLLPGIGSLVVHLGGQTVPLFRSTYSDLNMTLALALISVIGVNIIAIFYLRRFYFKKWLTALAPFEIFSEFAKIISFSFRLFGNIFAGDVLLIVIFSLSGYILPVPFIGLEIFVGFIQALIFTALTAIFLKVALIQTSH